MIGTLKETAGDVLNIISVKGRMNNYSAKQIRRFARQKDMKESCLVCCHISSLSLVPSPAVPLNTTYHYLIVKAEENPANTTADTYEKTNKQTKSPISHLQLEIWQKSTD